MKFDYTMSGHAFKRWIERCRGLDLCTEMAWLKPPTHGQGKRIRRDNPAHQHFNLKYVDRFNMVSKNNVVFVIGRNDRVITVYRLGEK